MSFRRLLRLFHATRPSSTPSYLTVKEERTRRWRAELVFSIALVLFVFGRLLTGATDDDSGPSRSCTIEQVESRPSCAMPPLPRRL